MTINTALAEARRRWGKTAMVESRKRGAFIGQHDEFVESYRIVSDSSNRQYKKNDPVGHYRCGQCNEFHLPTKAVTHYVVGKLMLGMFFEVRGSGLTWASAFQAAESFENRFKAKA